MNYFEQNKTVKSIVLEEYGSYDKINIKNMPLNNLGHDDICVSVEFCGVNFCDILVRQGFLRELTTPRILGCECVGTIDNIGKNVKNFQLGDRVLCYVWTGGLFREKVIVPAINCYLIPSDISSQDAVSLPANYLTAYISVFTMGNLQSGDTILIHSAAGGVGCAATQLAKTVNNVTIVGTASEFKHNKLKENGVHYTLSHENYVNQAKEITKNGFDVIIDSIGGANIEISKNLLKTCGRLVLIGGSTFIHGDTLNIIKTLYTNWQTKNIHPRSVIELNISISGVHLGLIFDSDPQKINSIMTKLFKMLKMGYIKPIIFETVNFENVIEAQKLLSERKNFGKVILALK
ncbi:synaptic vesicle membrane protein VAT-1 homolog [Daktulosphaira vitifoliae]|uniref:synaptic vesicle membrane protein VAT-1 homolog n=1 Tax=Daktulosphaira vitifoliae TaxID=58002 RepID=UPI0021A9AE9F|nr:synaptic vesicle membrane protein VAT-1 homolog [Daktulosphaira vitifoliae]